MTCYHRIMILPHGAVQPTGMGMVEIPMELAEAVCLLGTTHSKGGVAL